MKNFPLDRYKFIVSGNTVVALSTYAGRPVRGIAKCDPRDTFDLEFGKKLAAARCAERVAYKRFQRAKALSGEAYDAMNAATKRCYDMALYYNDARTAFVKANDALEELEKNA